MVRMFIRASDQGDETEWRQFLATHGFGELVAAGRNREVPVVVPTQFALEGDELLVHLIAGNPMFDALAENPRVLLAVSGDWSYIPSDWKAIGDEDPSLGIPTTFYASVQVTGTATVEKEPAAVAEVLRRQTAALQPGTEVVDPMEHGAKLRAIHGLRISVDAVRAKFKYGGNVDDAHRSAIMDRLAARSGPGDAASLAHMTRRTPR